MKRLENLVNELKNGSIVWNDPFTYPKEEKRIKIPEAQQYFTDAQYIPWPYGYPDFNSDLVQLYGTVEKSGLAQSATPKKRKVTQPTPWERIHKNIEE